MSVPRGDPRQAGDDAERASSLPTEFDWREGSRTDAWRELWRRLLADVLAEYARSASLDDASDQAPDGD